MWRAITDGEKGLIFLSEAGEYYHYFLDSLAPDNDEQLDQAMRKIFQEHPEFQDAWENSREEMEIFCGGCGEIRFELISGMLKCYQCGDLKQDLPTLLVPEALLRPPTNPGE